MKRSSVFLVILLLVVVAAAVLSVKLFFGGSPAETEPPQQIHTPVPATAAPEETADPTPTPAEPTPNPTPTEEPVFETRPPITEPPQETEGPAGIHVTGNARSNTGTGLNMVLNWTADFEDGAETGTFTVEVSAESYSFFTSALYDAVELTVNGETFKASSAAVSYDGADLIKSPIASFTVEIPRGLVSYAVVWHYKGSYSGVDLEDIRAAGSFSINI